MSEKGHLATGPCLMHYRFQIRPKGRAGLSEKCQTQRLWIPVFSSMFNWASKAITNLLYKLKSCGYQFLFKDLQPLKSWNTRWQLSSPACRDLRCVMVLWTDQRQKRGKDGERQTQEGRRRATCRNKVWRGTWCRGSPGVQGAPPCPGPGDAPEDTDTRKSTCGHAECVRRRTSPVTERCRRWVGVSVLSSPSGTAAQSWLIVWSSFQSQGPILWDWDWDKKGTENDGHYKPTRAHVGLAWLFIPQGGLKLVAVSFICVGVMWLLP